MFVREHTRYPVELAVRMKCSTWADYLELHTGNLSRGGLFVPSAITAPIGTEIAIELTLPNATVVKVRGEVVHVTGAAAAQVAGLGVMFSGLDDEAQRALDDALRMAKEAAAPPSPKTPSPPPVAPTKVAPPAPKPAEPPPPKPAAPPPPKQAAPPPPKSAVPHPPKHATPPPPKHAAPPPPKQAAPPPPSAPPDARAPKFTDAVEQALLDELARRIDLPPHEQLAVTPEAGDDEIADAWRRLKERYAPAIFARYGASTAAVLKSINAAIDAAYRRLQDPRERRALLIAAHQPKASDLSPEEQEQKRRGEEARAALRAGIERRVEEACTHRDLGRVDEAIRSFEAVLALDRKHDYARAELAKLRDVKAKRRR
jgi:uncharacterized protein (TIGR02266 family)